MKKLLIGLLVLGSFSAIATECTVGTAQKIIKLTKTKNYVIKADGFSYMIKYDASKNYLALSIEGGEENMNATSESFGSKKSYLSLGKKGDWSDIVISCE